MATTTLEPPRIRPRADWAWDLPALGPLATEEDVRFLLVHHTASPNVGPEASIAQLRSFYGYHTSVEKGWPDIAYNFLVDSGGQIWEGRTGSLAGPVRGDATGGSQGHALLCCFIGTFADTPPTEAASGAMTHLLAWLAQTYAVSLAEGAAVTFTSRGSDRWPAGSSVTTPTIAGHRDMSQTTCPGDTAYAMLETTFRPGARALLASSPAVTAAPSQEASVSSSPTSSAESTDPAPSNTSPGTRSTAPPGNMPPTTGMSPSRTAGAAGEAAPGTDSGWLSAAGGVGATAALAALGWVLRRRIRAIPPTDSHPPST